jgi:hypothetical protein
MTVRLLINALPVQADLRVPLLGTDESPVIGCTRNFRP